MYARQNFGQLLNEVSLLNETFVIQRANRPMAALVPVESVADITLPDQEVVEAFRNLVKRMKGPRSKKLDKAINDLGALLYCEPESGE